MSMYEVVYRYLKSPNNTLPVFKGYLKSRFGWTSSSHKGQIDTPNGTWTVAVTGAKEDVLQARQFDNSTRGLVTIWMRNGGVYVIPKERLAIGTVTREFEGVKYHQVWAEPDSAYMYGNTPDMYKKMVTETLKEIALSHPILEDIDND